MPEGPLTPARRHVAPEEEAGAPARAPFVELGLVTCFSFLRGASDPVDLVLAAHRLGYDALGVADVNSLAGVVRAAHGSSSASSPGSSSTELWLATVMSATPGVAIAGAAAKVARRASARAVRRLLPMHRTAMRRPVRWPRPGSDSSMPPLPVATHRR